MVFIIIPSNWNISYFIKCHDKVQKDISSLVIIYILHGFFKLSHIPIYFFLQTLILPILKVTHFHNMQKNSGFHFLLCWKWASMWISIVFYSCLQVFNHKLHPILFNFWKEEWSMAFQINIVHDHTSNARHFQGRVLKPKWGLNVTERT